MKTYLKPSSEDFITRLIWLILGILFLFIGFCFIPYIGGYKILIGGVISINCAIFLKPQKRRFKNKKLDVRRMKKFVSKWWGVQLPENWKVEQDDICTSMFSESGFGVLQISAGRNNDGFVTDDDLKEFFQEHLDAGAHVKPLSCGEFTGFYIDYSIEKTYQRQWWLRCDNVVTFVTYTSDLDDKGKEDIIVDNILITMKKQ